MDEKLPHRQDNNKMCEEQEFVGDGIEVVDKEE